MDPIDYCERLESEVIGWKAKVDDVIIQENMEA